MATQEPRTMVSFVAVGHFNGPHIVSFYFGGPSKGTVPALLNRLDSQWEENYPFAANTIICQPADAGGDLKAAMVSSIYIKSPYFDIVWLGVSIQDI